MNNEARLEAIIICDRSIWGGSQDELDRADKIMSFRFWQPEGAALLNEIITQEKVALN